MKMNQHRDYLLPGPEFYDHKITAPAPLRLWGITGRTRVAKRYRVKRGRR